MDKQPLNTGEQKDMAEFFTDLISKLEEMNDNLVCILLFFQRNVFLDSCCKLVYNVTGQ